MGRIVYVGFSTVHDAGVRRYRNINECAAWTVWSNSPTSVVPRRALGQQSGGYYYTDVFYKRARPSYIKPQEGFARRGFKNNQWAAAAAAAETLSARNAII